jgi:3-oxoacyl-[acyl-carrier-protein] synthase I
MFGAHRLHHVTLADKIGETGAAAGAAMLSWLLSDLNHSATRPGKTGVIHLANDDGTRCAVVVQYQGEQ